MVTGGAVAGTALGSRRRRPPQCAWSSPDRLPFGNLSKLGFGYHLGPIISFEGFFAGQLQQRTGHGIGKSPNAGLEFLNPLCYSGHGPH
jgi:hypothetical protein